MQENTARCRGGSRAIAHRETPWTDWSNYWATGDNSSRAFWGKNLRGVNGSLIDLEYARVELIKFNLFDNSGTFSQYVNGPSTPDGLVDGAAIKVWPEMRLPPTHPNFADVGGGAPEQHCRGQLVRFRTLTGICNDTRNPLMGSSGTLFARNVEFETTFPDQGLDPLARNRHGNRLSLLSPDPQVISRRLFTRAQSDSAACNNGFGKPGYAKDANCDYKKAPFFNVLAAFWIQFMRLRSGELLRVRGRVAQTDRATFWKRLSVNINTEQCVPFLGPRINSGIVPRPEAIARWLAAGNGYALADADKLARVAQFEAYKDPSAFRSMYMKRLKEGVYRSVGRAPTAAEVKQFDKQTLRAVTDAVGWGEASKKVEECRIYHALADLQLPLYVTTNVDDFMYEALTHHPKLKGEDVRRIGPRWQKATEGAPPHSVLQPEPSATTPYLLHLNGFDDETDRSQIDHVALSEDDLLAKFVRLARDQVEIIPSNIVTKLAESSWLFLGYDIDDWEFRVVVQGLLQPIAQARTTTKLHIGVQLEVGPGGTGVDEQAVQRYLQGYLEQRFRITVYWGSPAQFVAELNRRLLED